MGAHDTTGVVDRATEGVEDGTVFSVSEKPARTSGAIMRR